MAGALGRFQPGGRGATPAARVFATRNGSMTATQDFEAIDRIARAFGGAKLHRPVVSQHRRIQ
jgi:hypothetical protein